MKVQRRPGIELLRIIAIFGVIMIHYYEAVKVFATDPLSAHSLIILRSLSASAVDVFIVISGYFLVSSNTRKLGKALTLFVQVQKSVILQMLPQVSMTYHLGILYHR